MLGFIISMCALTLWLIFLDWAYKACNDNYRLPRFARNDEMWIATLRSQ